MAFWASAEDPQTNCAVDDGDAAEIILVMAQLRVSVVLAQAVFAVLAAAAFLPTARPPEADFYRQVPAPLRIGWGDHQIVRRQSQFSRYSLGVIP